MVLSGVGLQSNPISAKPRLHAVRRQVLHITFSSPMFWQFSSYWVGQPFGFVVSMAFGLVFAYLTIVTGRWLFGKMNL